MHKLIQWIDNIYRFLGLDFFNPYRDFARAGHAPASYDYKPHHALARIAVTLGLIHQDALFVDLSHWNGEINFVKLKSMRVIGVILKCGQGLLLDKNFVTNWRKAKEAGLMRGSYWFNDSRVEPERQARTYADALKTYGFGELPHFMDYEENYGGPWRGIVNLAMFRREFQRLTGLGNDKIGIYTGYYYWLENGSSDSFWSEIWLWEAWYGDEEDVLVPLPWTQDKVFGWQFTNLGDGIRFGVESKELDLNWFVKGLKIWEALYGEVEDVPIPSEGEEGMYAVYSSSYRMSLRESPSINGNWVEQKPIGTVFVCDIINIPPVSGGLLSDKWAHVISVNGVTKDLYVAQVHNGTVYCRADPMTAQGKPVASIRFTDEDGNVWIAENVTLNPE